MIKSVQQFSTCLKHKKLPSILVVKEARYVCEDCAIFEPRYKQEHMMEKEAVSRKIEQIARHCNDLLQQQESLQSSIDQNMTSLLRTIEHYQVSVINQINNQFSEVKTKVSEVFIQTVSNLGGQKKGNAKARLDQLMREKSCQQKIRKHYEGSNELNYLRQVLAKQMQKVKELYETIKQQIKSNVSVKIDVLAAFQPLLEVKLHQTSQVNQQPESNDDNLLDFSDFLIPMEQNQPKESVTFTLEDSFFSMKRHPIERMKTAACLEDSMCSEFSATKSFESQIFNLAISEIVKKNQSENLASDRSISCTSTVSNSQPPSQAVSKKYTIEITTSQEINTKLLSIPPTIKSIRFFSLPITCQEFSQLMKEKISRSFINSLEIVNCPKLNDKILMEIKTHKCKSLKRVEIKECKEFSWGDKKVKEIVKKLESEGVKIYY